MKNNEVTQDDLYKAYLRLYLKSQTVEYKSQLIWFLDREKPNVSDRLRKKLKIELIRDYR